MRKVMMRDARKGFKETVELAQKGERTAIYRHKKAMAVMVSVEDYRLLRALEDRVDAEDARKALAEAEALGTIPWDQVKAELES